MSVPVKASGPSPHGTSQGLAQRDGRGDETLDRVKRRAHWTERFVRLMDDGVRLPLIGGLGLDAVLGFFLPVAGDTLTGLGSLALLSTALRRGVPTVILGRMVLNIAVDVFIGLFPVVGDFFDIVWRSNRRNLSLIDEYAPLDGEVPDKKPGALDYLLVGGGMLLAVTAIVLPMVLIALLGHELAQWFQGWM